MQFELMRLSVLPRLQMDSFERVKTDGSPFTREQWLCAVFSHRIEFFHRGTLYHYVPYPQADVGGEIAGRIGRKLAVRENDSPDLGLVDVVRDTWRAATVLIDPRHHSDGQKVAFENNAQVGAPLALFESLTNHVNLGAEPFQLEVNAIVASSSFWEFADKNSGNVVFVEFEFIAPNMFGGADDYDKEMKELQDIEKVQKAKLSIESKDGLNLNSDKVKAAVNYTSRGTGSTRARTKGGSTYNSKKRGEKITVPKKVIDQEPKEKLILRMINIIFKI